MRPTIEYDPSYTLLTLDLDPGEVIKAEPGAMVAQEGVDMTTGMGSGSIMGGLRRMLGGESFAVNTFTAQSGGGWVSLAPSAPGDIASFHLGPRQEPVHPGRLIHGVHRERGDGHASSRGSGVCSVERTCSS